MDRFPPPEAWLHLELDEWASELINRSVSIAESTEFRADVEAALAHLPPELRPPDVSRLGYRVDGEDRLLAVREVSDHTWDVLKIDAFAGTRGPDYLDESSRKRLRAAGLLQIRVDDGTGEAVATMWRDGVPEWRMGPGAVNGRTEAAAWFWSKYVEITSERAKAQDQVGPRIRRHVYVSAPASFIDHIAELGIATVVDDDAPAIGSVMFRIDGKKLKTAQLADQADPPRLRRAFEKWQAKRRINHLPAPRLSVARVGEDSGSPSSSSD